MLSMLRALMALAIANGDRDTDPTTGIKRGKVSNEGWHTWTEDEITQFEARHPIGSPARLAFALALYTGQRSADLIRMGRQHVREGRISLVQQKTGKALSIPIHPALKAIIEATPSDQLTFIISEHQKPFASAQSFGFRLRTWAREAGLTGCPLHGLRKAVGGLRRPAAPFTRSRRSLATRQLQRSSGTRARLIRPSWPNRP
jgi:integrase